MTGAKKSQSLRFELKTHCNACSIGLLPTGGCPILAPKGHLSVAWQCHCIHHSSWTSSIEMKGKKGKCGWEVDLSVPSFSNLRRKLRRHFFLYIHLRRGFEGQDEVEVKDTLPSLAIYWPNFRYILFRYMVPDMPSGTWSHPVASVKVTHLHRTPR